MPSFSFVYVIIIKKCCSLLRVTGAAILVGIYKIENIINGKVYIGQSLDVKKREKTHINELRLNKHCNCWLQDDWNIYGEDAFTFEVIHKCRSVYLNQAEKYYIDKYEATDREHGYNIQSGIGKGMDEPRWNKARPYYVYKYHNHPYSENVFFKNEDGEIEYNSLCKDCDFACKQSHKAIIMICPIMCKKR